MRLAYPFNHRHQDPSDHEPPDRELIGLLGGKGAGLAAMTAAGLPVPPGFTLVTEACRSYLRHGWTAELEQAIDEGIAELSRQTGKSLGSVDSPLLVSVRSGAEVSMPGMMDTVLNVGMNDRVEAALAALSGDPAFAADTHRRALLSFAEIVLAAPAPALSEAAAATTPGEVAAALARSGFPVDPDPTVQLKSAIRAVFDSWTAPRAVHYREIEGIDGSTGTAATVQSMVFGNMGQTSGTGVAFSRNPTTGEAGLMGDFLADAQGEDVVAGDHVTRPLSDMAEMWPDLHRQLEQIAAALEADYRDMVDIEFTIEQGRLWMLQTRRGKRSPIAAFRMAIEMAEDPEFPVDRAEAVDRCRRYFDAPPLIATDDDPARDLPVVAEGLGASPGRASGVLCLDPDRAVALQDEGRSVILARRMTSPADVHGMAASVGLFTTLGGQVSHAALVAREWGLPAVVGASEAEVQEGALVGPGGRVEEGTIVTVDGDGGRLLVGEAPVHGKPAPEVLTVKRWAETIDGSVETESGATGGEGLVASGPDSSGPTAGQPQDLPFRVFHALRIKGMITAETVAAMCGCDEEAAGRLLGELVGTGRATFMEPRAMWVITPDGREAHQPALAEALGAVTLDGLPYQPFLALNDEFKQLCTDWQVRDGEPNDHGDAAYDDAIRGRLADLDERAQPIIGAIAERVPWMEAYGARLGAARERVASADPKALTGVMCDSYHDIWMELHEDLILTQGIDRAAEGST